ncbi:unnamed protein product [Penicillium salamii]|nr:unnamed protein product [Penicillium salamii]CAG8410208.1 unnamed protein product [Penicillium salamii]
MCLRIINSPVYLLVRTSIRSTATMDSSRSQDVPRFSSFRPPLASLTAETDSEDGEHSRHSRRTRLPRRLRRHRQQSKKRHRDLQIAAEARLENSAEHKDVRTEANETNVNFVLDARGDRDIARYGSSRYQVPAYHRAGNGFVVGAPGQRIAVESRHEGTLVLHDAEGRAPSKPLSSASLSALTAASPPLAPYVQSTGSFHPITSTEHLQDFISTELPPQPGILSTIPHLDDHKPLQILGESDTGTSARNSSVKFTTESEILNRNNQLCRTVKRDHTDIIAWLRLAEHQEIVITGPRYDNRSLTYSEAQLVANAKLSVYEKAIRKNHHNPQLDHLVLGRMELGAILWDSVKLTQEWGEVLARHPEFISLWVEYLNYCQRDPVDFTFEKCFNSYIYCLSVNSRVGSGLYKNQIRSYLLLRLTLFLRESGNTELAVGLWQAVLEFTCFRPAHIEDPQQALEEFGKYWTSQTAHIGDRGWIGWNGGGGSYLNSNAGSNDFDVNADFPDLFKTWARAERERMVKCRVPSSNFNATQEDGSHRAVLDIDFKQVLPYFLDYNDNFQPLVNGFLYFCHLPSLATEQNIRDTRLWSGDNFLRNEFMDDPRNTIADWIKLQNDGETTAIKPFDFPHQNFVQTKDTLFADPKNWFSSLSKWAETTSHASSVVDPDFVRRVLYGLVDNFEDQALAEYTLAITFACNNNRAKQYAKHLLRKRSSDLRLYNAIALIHWRTGDHSFAVKVWANALAMSQNSDTQTLNLSAALWSSWMWELLDDGQDKRVAYLLQAMPHKTVDILSYGTADDTELNPTHFLRLQNYLVTAQHNAFALNDAQAYSSYTDCYAIALYLNGQSLRSILGIYDAAVISLNALEEDVKIFTGELLHQARARFIYLWVDKKKGQFKPYEIRELFHESLLWYPHNTMFLSLFKWNDARVSPINRTRDILSVTTGRAANRPNVSPHTHRVPITTHLFSIYVEMGRPVVYGSTTHSIRAAFERAIGDSKTSVGSTPTRHHPYEVYSSVSAQSNLTVWRLYILFELYGERDVSRACEIYHRAVRACPWSKELYMIAFEHLRADLTAELPPCRTNPKAGAKHPGLSDSDLRALYSVMLQRGFRIHHHVEEFWEHQRAGSEMS